MNSATLVVLKKELKEMFRDKRVRTGAFIMPIVIMFMLMGVFGFVIGAVKDTHNTKIHVVSSNSPIIAAFKKAKLTVIEVQDVAKGQELIRKGEARVLLDVKSKSDGGIEVVQMDAYVDPKEQQGQIALAMISEVVREANKQAVKAVFAAKGIPESAQEPIKLVKHDLKVGSDQNAGEFLVSILPYLIVIWAFYGGMSIAGDLVAGEKEKATLETLLITPAHRTEIVLGKFLALGSVCLLSSFMTVIGLVLVKLSHLPGTSELMGKSGVTPVAALVILLLMIPTAALFASMLVAVSSYAKNAREAQTYMTSLSFLVVLPGIFSQFIGLTDFGTKMWINLVPILNTANNIRNALLCKTEFVPLLITISISTILAAIALTVTVKLFQREQVLVRV